jgi:hypothetical protein
MCATLALVIACSLVAVVCSWDWSRSSAELDPFSILVPFCVRDRAHGAQKMNGIMQDIGRGTQARCRPLHVPAAVPGRLTALLADAVGFAVLMVIDIPRSGTSH